LGIELAFVKNSYRYGYEFDFLIFTPLCKIVVWDCSHRSRIKIDCQEGQMKTKKKYEKPKIVFEMDLKITAGSTISTSTIPPESNQNTDRS